MKSPAGSRAEIVKKRDDYLAELRAMAEEALRTLPLSSELEVQLAKDRQRDMGVLQGAVMALAWVLEEMDRDEKS